MTTNTATKPSVKRVPSTAEVTSARLDSLTITDKRLIDTDYANAIFARVRRDQFVARFPISWAHTGNATLRKLQKDMIEGVKQRCKRAEVHPETFYAIGESGIADDPDSARYLQGFAMNPGMQPIIDNRQSRKLIGLGDPDPADLERARHLCRVIFQHVLAHGDLSARPVRVPRDSTMGLPDGVKNTKEKPDAKMEEILRLMGQGTELRAAFEAEDTAALASMGIERCYILGSRMNQGDSFKDGKPKDRPVYSWQSDRARAKGMEVKPIIAARDIEGESYLFRVRERMVYAFCARYNIVISVLSEPFRDSLKLLFPQSFGAKESTWLNDVLRKYGDVVTFDAMQFDSTVPMELLAVIASELGMAMAAAYGGTSGTGHFLGWLLWKAITAPVLARNGVLGEGGARYIGDPHDWTQDLFNGIPSGIAIVTLLGTIAQLLNSVLTMEKSWIKPMTDEQFLALLKGRDERFGLTVRSDDTALFFNTRRSRMRHRDFSKIEGALIKMELENFATMLGYKVHQIGDEKEFRMSSLGILKKVYLDERDAIARAATLGVSWQSACSVYCTGPGYKDVMGAMEDVAQDYGFDLHATMLGGGRDSSYAGRTFEENLLMIDPSYMHYRIDPEAVSPEVVDSIVHTIPASVCANFINAFIKEPVNGRTRLH